MVLKILGKEIGERYRERCHTCHKFSSCCTVQSVFMQKVLIKKVLKSIMKIIGVINCLIANFIILYCTYFCSIIMIKFISLKNSYQSGKILWTLTKSSYLKRTLWTTNVDLNKILVSNSLIFAATSPFYLKMLSYKTFTEFYWKKNFKPLIPAASTFPLIIPASCSSQWLSKWTTSKKLTFGLLVVS